MYILGSFNLYNNCIPIYVAFKETRNSENSITNPESIHIIRKTYPCNVNPLKPDFCIVKLGYTGVNLFFLFLLQNIDCCYSLERPHRGGSNVYPQAMFPQKKKEKYQKFSTEFFFFNFYNLVNISINYMGMFS